MAQGVEKHSRTERDRRVDFDRASPGGRNLQSVFWSAEQRHSWSKVDADSLFGFRRVTAEDRRRDAWLADSRKGNARGSSGKIAAMETEDSPHRYHSEVEQQEELAKNGPAVEGQGAERRPSRIQQVEDIEIELARVTGNKPWQRNSEGGSSC